MLEKKDSKIDQLQATLQGLENEIEQKKKDIARSERDKKLEEKTSTPVIEQLVERHQKFESDYNAEVKRKMELIQEMNRVKEQQDEKTR